MKLQNNQSLESVNRKFLFLNIGLACLSVIVNPSLATEAFSGSMPTQGLITESLEPRNKYNGSQASNLTYADYEDDCL